MEEGIKLGLVPQQLSATRHGEHRARRVVGIAHLELLEFKFWIWGLGSRRTKHWQKTQTTE